MVTTGSVVDFTEAGALPTAGAGVLETARLGLPQLERAFVPHLAVVALAVARLLQPGPAASAGVWAVLVDGRAVLGVGMAEALAGMEAGAIVKRGTAR